MEYLKLIGILIILIGFIFKVDTIAVVILAGLATALVSGLSLLDFLTLLGDAFVSNRLVTLFPDITNDRFNRTVRVTSASNTSD